MLLQLLQGLFTVFCQADAATKFEQHAFGHHLVHRVVFNQQNFGVWQRRLCLIDHLQLGLMQHVLAQLAQQCLPAQWLGYLLERGQGTAGCLAEEVPVTADQNHGRAGFLTQRGK